MDFEIPSPIFTSLILLPILVFLIKNLQRSHATSSPKLPPGPGKLHMLLSSLKNLITPEFPHISLKNLADKHGGIMHLRLGEISTVVISTPEFAKQILKTHDIAFASRPRTLFSKIISYNERNISFTPYGEYWRQMRKMCTLELLSAKMVRSFASIREEEVSNMMKFVESSKGSPVNLTPEIFRYTNAVICKVTVGRRYEDEGTLVELVHGMMSTNGGLNLVDLFPSNKLLHFLFNRTEAKLMKMNDKVGKILDAIIDEHVTRRVKEKSQGEMEEEDLVDVLLRLKEQGTLQFPITFTNIKAIIMDMFLAGTDTSAVTILWAMSELLKNPNMMKRAQAEVRQILKGEDTIQETDLKDLRYLKMVIAETLRLHLPGPMLLPRECREETIVHGYHIPAKTRVIINAWAINRDPESWENPESFIPERFEGKEIEFMGPNMDFLTFGAGRRVCPGITFGMATTELALAKLLYYYNWELPDRMKHQDMDMSEEFSLSLVLSRKNPLILIPTPFRAT